MRTAFSITLAVLFIVLMCGTKNIAQDSSSGFLVGAFIASSPNAAYTLYNNYDQILDCGFNSVWQYAKKTDSTNLDQLAQFQYVFTHFSNTFCTPSLL